MTTTVTLSLISHTNVGKTTLARTLLRRDIGEVRDQAHVTEVSEAHTLIEEGDAKLLLWDTPGLGDTARLVKRLRSEQNPIGWFLHSVWDRATDRPLWCSQEALRNVREDTDVVLYLVNASEDPEDAGYVQHELEILDWLKKPVLVLLNQTGSGDRDLDALTARWNEVVEEHPVVHGTLALDAFTRCWIHEDHLFERVAPLLGPQKGGAMRRLAAEWRRRNRETFEESVTRMARELARAATDREPLAATASKAQREEAMRGLTRRLETAESQLWDAVIAAYGLEGKLAAEAKRHLDDFHVTRTEMLTPKKGALLGGALSGAVSGLAADLLAGGFTFGGGLLAGTLLGALGGAGLSRALQWVRNAEEPRITWSVEFLDVLFAQTALRYLAVAHFGRGRGEFREDTRPARWQGAVESAVRTREERLHTTWKRAADGGPASLGEAQAALERVLHDVIEGTLRDAYKKPSAVA